MISCFHDDSGPSVIPIHVITQLQFAGWLSGQAPAIHTWLADTQFQPEADSIRLLPDENGKLARVLCCVKDMNSVWEVGGLPITLPQGKYRLEVAHAYYQACAIVWGLGAYQFTRYKKPLRQPAQLFLPSSIKPAVSNIVESIYLVRDCINTPTEDMGPSEFAAQFMSIANQNNATCTELIGDELLQHHYTAIHAVGRASNDAPRLVDLRWGKADHPKVTLVGKGVCFDSGGLDIKSSAHMLLMKKDMAGGAHVLGLARMIMQANLPVCLRVLVPMVENVISGNAYRPGDIITSRKGITIEVGNTDAEGRLVVADALSEAVSGKPELLIDITTLTGAARVALGPDLPAVFSNHDTLVTELIKHSEQCYDPMWRLPLFAPYREYLYSPIADINNHSYEPYAGAITAALFLKEFVPDEVPWLHFDIMAWNLRPRPGRPQGGEAMALRALFSYLTERYGSSNENVH